MRNIKTKGYIPVGDHPLMLEAIESLFLIKEHLAEQHVNNIEFLHHKLNLHLNDEKAEDTLIFSKIKNKIEKKGLHKELWEMFNQRNEETKTFPAFGNTEPLGDSKNASTGISGSYLTLIDKKEGIQFQLHYGSDYKENKKEMMKYIEKYILPKMKVDFENDFDEIDITRNDNVGQYFYFRKNGLTTLEEKIEFIFSGILNEVMNELKLVGLIKKE